MQKLCLKFPRAREAVEGLKWRKTSETGELFIGETKSTFPTESRTNLPKVLVVVWIAKVTKLKAWRLEGLERMVSFLIRHRVNLKGWEKEVTVSQDA